MGALTLLRPGHGGPCADPCSHSGCATHRKLSSTPCVVCGQPLGFGTPVYCYKTRTGHVVCIEEAVNRSLLKLLAGLTAIAAEHHLKTDLAWDDNEARRFGEALRAEMDRTAEKSPPRALKTEVFLLPSSDLQCEILRIPAIVNAEIAAS
jgi:hypothetical protein